MGERLASSKTKRERSVRLLNLLVADAVDPHLELEGRDDRAEVGVAAAFAEAVDGALHLDAAQLDRDQGVGHGQLGVVVGVDAQGDVREVLLDRLDDLDHLGGQGAAVGVAEDDDSRPAGLGRLEGLEGIVRIVLEAVEEVFGVVEQLSAPGA